ncbi:MAG: hypothetical protein KAJ28_00680 [Flavobacteriaceae bacterium]|nr:hypothetical protein [Flavobacteriaceae bacterium]
MKKYLVVLIISCTNLLLQDLFSQESFATIEKNVHISARGLFHDLNKSKDTLLLKSDKAINYVYSINRDYKREVDKYINANSYKVPLKNLSIGKHLFVVRQSPVLIVFVIRILKDHPTIISTSEK